MSLPKEIQNIVDKCEAKGYEGALIVLFDRNMDLRANPWKEADTFFRQITEEVGYEVLEEQTGGEGEGEYCYSVIKIGDKYFKAEWSYYSYNGCDYDYIEDTIKEVTPSTKTITVYN